jgi:hypothetical protein
MALPDFLGRSSDEVASPSLPVSLVFIVAAVLGIGFLAGQWAVLVYVLSFWHYPIYALAFVSGRCRSPCSSGTPS